MNMQQRSRSLWRYTSAHLFTPRRIKARMLKLLHFRVAKKKLTRRLGLLINKDWKLS